VELGVGVELLREQAGLALLGFRILFGRRQVEDQVCDDEGLGCLMEPGDIFLAEAREVDGVDLFGTVEFAQTRPETRTLTSASKPNSFSASGA
jgi:hypothetical protein